MALSTAAGIVIAIFVVIGVIVILWFTYCNIKRRWQYHRRFYDLIHFVRQNDDLLIENTYGIRSSNVKHNITYNGQPTPKSAAEITTEAFNIDTYEKYEKEINKEPESSGKGTMNGGNLYSYNDLLYMYGANNTYEGKDKLLGKPINGTLDDYMYINRGNDKQTMDNIVSLPKRIIDTFRDFGYLHSRAKKVIIDLIKFNRLYDEHGYPITGFGIFGNENKTKSDAKNTLFQHMPVGVDLVRYYVDNQTELNDIISSLYKDVKGDKDTQENQINDNVKYIIGYTWKFKNIKYNAGEKPKYEDLVGYRCLVRINDEDLEKIRITWENITTAEKSSKPTYDIKVFHSVLDPKILNCDDIDELKRVIIKLQQENTKLCIELGKPAPSYPNVPEANDNEQVQQTDESEENKVENDISGKTNLTQISTNIGNDDDENPYKDVLLSEFNPQAIQQQNNQAQANSNNDELAKPEQPTSASATPVEQNKQEQPTIDNNGDSNQQQNPYEGVPTYPPVPDINNEQQPEQPTGYGFTGGLAMF